MGPHGTKPVVSDRFRFHIGGPGRRRCRPSEGPWAVPNLRTCVHLPPQANFTARRLGQANAVGDSMADDPDDSFTVADQWGVFPSFARDPLASEEVVQGGAATSHPQR